MIIITNARENLKLFPELGELLDKSNVTYAESKDQLVDLALGGKEQKYNEVYFDVPGKGQVLEATVARCKNGASVNYPETYMRRRDPNCMVIGDDKETDKARFKDSYNTDFNSVRQETFDWLAGQDLLVLAFMAGGEEFGYPALLVAPKNAALFAGILADLQQFVPASKVQPGFNPKAIIYLAPPFRHTHFDGKQVVVHNRLDECHEVFSYNLYPGPSAKKGVYGVLLNIGEEEGWTTLHASTVKVKADTGEELVVMHEGASGGGKSEMLEHIHRQMDGRIRFSVNTVTGEQKYLDLKENYELHPITDDMALCPLELQQESPKLVIKDAEDGWFLRLDHITEYGTDPHLEKQVVHSKEPLMFLNLDGVPDATCLIWEHIMDAPDTPCPNPRTVMPRRLVPNIVNETVEVDLRSFGVRVPACTKENPTYGIVGMMHVLPPSLAWLWRLVAPRGHDNPSITDTQGMSSEGVGSYWPFATGKRVKQANLLLEQILEALSTTYILTPNQHIGAYKVGFNPQWIGRSMLAERGNTEFTKEELTPARCSLLGYALDEYNVKGIEIKKDLLQTNLQAEVGEEAYDKGAGILLDFFKQQLPQFLTKDLNPLGKEIIECCLDGGDLEQFVNFIPMNKIK